MYPILFLAERPVCVDGTESFMLGGCRPHATYFAVAIDDQRLECGVAGDCRVWHNSDPLSKTSLQGEFSEKANEVLVKWRSRGAHVVFVGLKFVFIVEVERMRGKWCALKIFGVLHGAGIDRARSKGVYHHTAIAQSGVSMEYTDTPVRMRAKSDLKVCQLL